MLKPSVTMNDLITFTSILKVKLFYGTSVVQKSQAVNGRGVSSVLK